MKDYSKMSDFELNVQVAESEGVNWYCPASCSPTGGWEYCGVGKLMLKDDAQLPDYCNNPSDAWPIIIANKIRVLPVMHMSDDNGEYLCTGEWEAGSLWSEDGAFYNSKYHCFSDENPLRSAMIVYLMMKDEEK